MGFNSQLRWRRATVCGVFHGSGLWFCNRGGSLPPPAAVPALAARWRPRRGHRLAAAGSARWQTIHSPAAPLPEATAGPTAPYSLCSTAGGKPLPQTLPRVPYLHLKSLPAITQPPWKIPKPFDLNLCHPVCGHLPKSLMCPAQKGEAVTPSALGCDHIIITFRFFTIILPPFFILIPLNHFFNVFAACFSIETAAVNHHVWKVQKHLGQEPSPELDVSTGLCQGSDGNYAVDTALMFLVSCLFTLLTHMAV